MNEIWIPCEGGGYPAAGRQPNTFFTYGTCAMCGQWIPTTSDGRVIRHNRDDIIARIERGDFDE